LRSHVDTEIAAAHIVISGKAVVLCQGDQLVDVVRNGQGVLNVLPLANIKSDVDAMIVSLAGRNIETKAQPSSITSQASAQTVAL
jgi:ribosome-interacting GTPase 1